MDIKKFDCVRLKDGREGTIVNVYNRDEFLVEFCDAEGKTIDLQDVPKEQIEAVTYVS